MANVSLWNIVLSEKATPAARTSSPSPARTRLFLGQKPGKALAGLDAVELLSKLINSHFIA